MLAEPNHTAIGITCGVICVLVALALCAAIVIGLGKIMNLSCGVSCRISDGNNNAFRGNNTPGNSFKAWGNRPSGKGFSYD